MKIAILAPSPVPFVIGGAEKLWWGMLHHLNQHTPHEAELIKLPAPERNFWEVLESYRRFSALDLSHFDRLITTKYPAWMCDHPDHVVYLQHTLRGLYDTYPAHLPVEPDTAHPLLEALYRFTQATGGERASLPELWQRLEALRAAEDLPADFAAFPGPWCRHLVRHLDRIGLNPRRIRRYFCISRTVANRPDYFPPGIRPAVMPHPSDLRSYPEETAPPSRNQQVGCAVRTVPQGAHGAPYSAGRPPVDVGCVPRTVDQGAEGAIPPPRRVRRAHHPQGTSHPPIFTLSRLDPPKRLDLLIRAYIQSGVELPLRIAGTGPAEAELRKLAAGSPGIQFLGRLTDAEVLQEYHSALFVPFIPYQEDMGLVTLEAFASGKPVLTTTDAGGPTEFVRHGENGLIVPPTAEDLARAIGELAADPARTRRMGQAGRESAAQVTWDYTLAPLVKPYPRRRILVVNTFPATPVNSGGRARLFNLYLAVSRLYPVTLLCLTHYGAPAQTLRHTENLTEIHVPQSLAHYRKEQALEAGLGASVGDIAAMLHYPDTPAFTAAFRALSREADLVVSAHCYLYPMIEALYPRGEVWYDAYNVESELKRQILGASPAAAPYLEAVADTEARLCARATHILAVSEEERQAFIRASGKDETAVHHIPNGVDVAATPYHDAAARARIKARLGLEGRFVALFMGSYHGPNITAARSVVELARLCPQIEFWLLGSVCIAFAGQPLPPNLQLLGEQPEAEKRALLAAADIALNPMHEGAGTSLKVLDFAAAGLPILSTGHGLRGLDLDCQRHCWCEKIGSFRQALMELEAGSPQEWDGRRRAARDLVMQEYDWARISEKILAIL